MLKPLRRGVLIVNFGGPREPAQIQPFLQELLCDRDVIRTQLPRFLNNIIMKIMATIRSRKVLVEYEHMGGKSPIYEETEKLATWLRTKFSGPIETFHRYLPSTHPAFLRTIQNMHDVDEIIVFPLFPQFSYATTGSIARWFQEKIPPSIHQKFRWIHSYCDHPLFIKAYAKRLHEWLVTHSVAQSKLVALCSFHGLPKSFARTGDPYSGECERSFRALAAQFPNILWKKSYQSKFGPGEWLRPYTTDMCMNPAAWIEDRSHIIVVPLAFTCDHIETLCEIENLYITSLRQAGYEASRLPALNQQSEWLEAIKTMIEQAQEGYFATSCNQLLVPSYCPCPTLCPRLGLCSCMKSV